MFRRQKSIVKEEKCEDNGAEKEGIPLLRTVPRKDLMMFQSQERCINKLRQI